MRVQHIEEFGGKGFAGVLFECESLINPHRPIKEIINEQERF